MSQDKEELHNKSMVNNDSDNAGENEVQFTLFKIDYRKLGEDLLKQIEADELYWIRNEAKLRAVTQAQCYEEFRQVVLAAHLKPVKLTKGKKDFQMEGC